MRFDANSYKLVVRQRGAVVLHELRLAMGLEGFVAGLRPSGRWARTVTH